MFIRNPILLLIAAVLFCGLAVAQEPNTETPAAQPTPASVQGNGSGVDQDSSSKPDALVPPPSKTNATVTSISDGSPLRVIPGMFHGGPLYLGSVQLSG